MKKLVEYIDNLIAKLLGVLSKYLRMDEYGKSFGVNQTEDSKLIRGAKVTPIDDLDDFVTERTEQNPQFTEMVDKALEAEDKATKKAFKEMDKCSGNCDCDGNCGDNYKCKEKIDIPEVLENVLGKMYDDKFKVEDCGNNNYSAKRCVCGDADCEAKNVKVVVKRAKMRKVYHVIPDKKGWAVKEEKNKNPSARADRKVDAVAKAKELAKKAKLGQVIVHKRDGKIQTEYTYGKDPRETKG